MKSKKIIYTLLLIICISIIFGFSNQNGTTSENLSNQVGELIIDITSKTTNKEISKNKKMELVEQNRKLIRKTAHFTIYLILGIIAYLTLKCYGVKNLIVFCILFCFIYACFDELHQVFVNERNGRILDVLIDTSGAFFGILLIEFIKKIRAKFYLNYQ